jgi:hypothetical protein
MGLAGYTSTLSLIMKLKTLKADEAAKLLERIAPISAVIVHIKDGAVNTVDFNDPATGQLRCQVNKTYYGEHLTVVAPETKTVLRSSCSVVGSLLSKVVDEHQEHELDDWEQDTNKLFAEPQKFERTTETVLA